VTREEGFGFYFIIFPNVRSKRKIFSAETGQIVAGLYSILSVVFALFCYDFFIKNGARQNVYSCIFNYIDGRYFIITQTSAYVSVSRYRIKKVSNKLCGNILIAHKTTVNITNPLKPKLV
jgi:hypothetical protein